MRMNFEIEIFTHNLAWIKVKGIRRGFITKTLNSTNARKWTGQLEGNKAELKISGSELEELKFEGILYKYKDPSKRPPPNIMSIYC